MCGIFGIYSKKKSTVINKNRFTDSLKIISHRGPDNINSHFHNSNALGHVRLSIIDLNKNSNQPFHSLDNRYSLIFNGEIFNYIEIKKDLESEGIVFKTESDTEVLLKAFMHWGKSCVQKFNGMWAFIIYDSHKDEFFCSRDRFGIKPLYYCQYNNQILVASEIKSILNYYTELAKPNYNVIANYCRTSIGGQHSQTWFKNISRITNTIVSNVHFRILRCLKTYLVLQMTRSVLVLANYNTCRLLAHYYMPVECVDQILQCMCRFWPNLLQIHLRNAMMLLLCCCCILIALRTRKLFLQALRNLQQMAPLTIWKKLLPRTIKEPWFCCLLR